MKTKVSVVGLGYVGLCTAVCFASRGFHVYGVDVDVEKINSLREGRSETYEPQLQRYLNKALKTRLFEPTVDLGSAVEKSSVTFVSVGTPSLDDGSIDLTYVKQSSVAIGASLKEQSKWHLVVVRSTVIPTTCDSVVKPAIEQASGKPCGHKWGLCMNPEFLREGSAIHDTLYPDRIIIGEYDERSGSALERLYRSFFRRKVPTKRMSMVNGELVKYANNAFLAMKVSFANMIANLCETVPAADAGVVTSAIGLDKRIGQAFLNAGLGYGGSCFPKDIKALTVFGRKQNIDLPLVHATAAINEEQPLRAIDLAEKLVGPLSGKQIAVLGLAFKPHTDDIREAVSIPIIKGLLQRHANIAVYDPKAIPQARRIFERSVTYAESATECIRDSDVCILVTEWECFRDLKPQEFATLMKKPAIVDGRRLFDPSQFSQVKYACVGLGPNQKTRIAWAPPRRGSQGGCRGAAPRLRFAKH